MDHCPKKGSFSFNPPLTVWCCCRVHSNLDHGTVAYSIIFTASASTLAPQPSPPVVVLSPADGLPFLEERPCSPLCSHYYLCPHCLARIAIGALHGGTAQTGPTQKSSPLPVDYLFLAAYRSNQLYKRRVKCTTSWE